MKIKGIIFDLDGTLIDSMHCWEEVDRNFLLENGIEPPEGISDIVKKMTIQDSSMYFKARFSLPQTCAEITNRIEEMVMDSYLNEIPMKPGVYETVRTLKECGFRLCVATANYRRLAEAALDRLGLLYMFEFVITCDDCGVGKNDPEIFLRAAERMDCRPKNTLVAEDSLHCLQAAASAGFPTVAVYDEVSYGDWDNIKKLAWKSVGNVSEILEILRKENSDG